MLQLWPHGWEFCKDLRLWIIYFYIFNSLHTGIGAQRVFAQCVNDDFIFLGAACSDSNQTQWCPCNLKGTSASDPRLTYSWSMLVRAWLILITHWLPGNETTHVNRTAEMAEWNQHWLSVCDVQSSWWDGVFFHGLCMQHPAITHAWLPNALLLLHSPVVVRWVPHGEPGKPACPGSGGRQGLWHSVPVWFRIAFSCVPGYLQSTPSTNLHWVSTTYQVLKTLIWNPGPEGTQSHRQK